MHPQNLLPTLAEISVTVVGFTAVILAFRPASAGTWSKEELVRIRSLLFGPGMVLALSVLPFGLSGFTDSPSVVWGVPLLLYGLTGSWYTWRTVAELRRGDVRLTNRALGLSLILVYVATNALAVLSGLGILMPFSAGLLVLALSWHLVVTGISLVLMIVFWSKTPAV